VIPTAAAIASAVEDALSGFGARITRVPIRPQDLIEQILPEAAA
jgi:carbon-monoxide dehydrogenase large subunit